MDTNQQTIFEKMDATLAEKVNNKLGCSVWLALFFVIIVTYTAFQIGRATTAQGTSIGVGGFFLGTIKADAMPALGNKVDAPVTVTTPPAQPQQEAPAPSTPIASLSMPSDSAVDNFNKLQIGMSFEQVLSIYGAPTKVLRSYSSDSPEGTKDFTWYRWGEARPQVTLLFKNGSLYVKEQKGLF
jgi:hypothetical protein